MNVNFEINCQNEDDGPFHFIVNGDTVASFDYDTHGWQAITDVKQMFKSIAEQLGQEVKYT